MKQPLHQDPDATVARYEPPAIEDRQPIEGLLMPHGGYGSKGY